MNHKLPSLKGKEVVRALKKAGFVERRTTGSHCILKNPSSNKIVPVPIHGSKDIKRGTLFSIIKQADMTIEEFIDLL
ncbi:type II toxin-antitoxin system HicA family toxin [Candidatus Saganbacteria bacterium]|nr:type II toxin-antitoxin system HicA family toxin [Candidatus Saganbacteria bacterium]